MKPGKGLYAICQEIRKLIHSEEYFARSITDEKAFSRKRKISFSQYIMLILGSANKSIRNELSEFFKEAGIYNLHYSRQAFSKGRKRIKPEAFKEIFELTVEKFYETAEVNRYKGFRIFAIDGSDINLPNSKELLEKFSSEQYANRKIVCQSQVSLLYDVLNGIVVDAQIGKCKSNEREQAEEHLKVLERLKSGDELLLFDRGYPSEKLMRSIDEKHFKYIMRCSKDNFFREVKAADEPDQYCSRKCSDNHVFSFRVINLTVGDTDETLITNLTEEELAYDDFAEVYHMRWGIETLYNNLKNKVQIENLLGCNLISYLQELYSSLSIINITAYSLTEIEREFEEKYKSGAYLHHRKVNKSSALNEIRHFLRAVLLKKKKINAYLKFVIEELRRSYVDVIPNRSFSRISSSVHYRIFNKNCL